MKPLRTPWVMFLIGLLLAPCLRAFAVPVDSFDVPQDIDFRREEHIIENGNRILHRSVSSPTILGGVRSVTMVAPVTSAFPPDFRVVVGSDIGSILSHSLGSSVAGTTLITWDGDGSLGVNPTGLGGLNLLSDGTTSLLLRVQAFDFASGRPLRVVLRVYTDAERISESVVDLTAPAQNAIFDLPVANLSPVGSAGGADLTKVGALQLLIDASNSPAADLEVDGIETNGTCQVTAFDQCKVCGGDNSSCADCAGVPFGTAKVDECGVCGGDGTTCLDCRGVANGPDEVGTRCETGASGICAAGIYAKDCVCTQLSAPIAEICDSLDNDCDGLIDEDTECRVVIEGNGCVTSTYEQPYKSIAGAGRKQDRLVRFTVTSELLWREGQKSISSRLIRRSRTLLRKSQSLVKTLPKVNTLFTQACQCTSSDQSEPLSSLARQNQEWLRLMRDVVQAIKDYRDGGVCEGTIEGCRIRLAARLKRWRDLIATMRGLVVEEVSNIKGSPSATGDCSSLASPT